MKIYHVLVCAFAFAIGSVFADEVYVATDGEDAEGRGASNAPFKTIAYAITSLGSEGGMVKVNTGTYTVSSRITVSTPVRVLGLGAAPSDTTLSGGGSKCVIKLAHADAVLENVTVADGYKSNAKTGDGEAPGLTVTAGTVTNCVVTACTGFNNWSVFANVYQTGGLITDCVISDGRLPHATADYADYHAAGAYLAGSARMERCLFKDFTHADARGYIALVSSASAVLTKCTVVNSLLKYRRTCPGYGIYASSGSVTDCAVIGVRRSGSTISSVYYAPGLAPWGGKASCFSNCATDGDAAINESCFILATDSAFADYPHGDYSPAPGSVLATQGIGYKAYAGSGLDAAFGINAYTGTTAFDFVFTASVANAAGTVSYSWDFDGDGTYDTAASASPSVTHRYVSVGTFSPKLKVSDGSSEKVVARTDLVKVAPAVIYVDAASSGAASPYDTPATAATKISDAVGVAEDGSEIRVAKGRYDLNNVTSGFTLTKGIRLIGQGEPSEVIVSNKTQSGTHYIGVLNHPDAFVANMCFQKGYVTTCPEYAAGITILANGGTVSNCIVTACTAHGNQSRTGGIQMSAGLVTRCVIEKCTEDNAQHMGSGVQKAGGALVLGAGRIENTLFRSYPSTHRGHIVWLASSAAVLENCTFVDSTLSYEDSSTPCNAMHVPSGMARNCVVYGVGRVAVGSTPATDDASWSGTAANFVNCATPGTPINATCKTITASAFADYANGDYTPAMQGALQDAGAEYTGVSQVDLAGSPRICGDVIDIGAYEYQSGGFSAQFTSSISQGVTPVPVEFTATVEGASGTLTYDWDFDDDGVYEVLARVSPTVTNTYTKAGVYNVTLRVHDSGSTSLEVTKENCLTLAPSVIYVDTESADPVAPYDDPAHAAANIPEAVAAGLSGSTVRVAPGTYLISDPLRLTDGIRVIGTSGNPADTILKNTVRSGEGLHSLAVVDNVEALIANFTLTNGYANCQPTYASGVTIGAGGGMVSNCVIVGCTGNINQDCAGGAYVKAGLLTHCVIEHCTLPKPELMVTYFKASGALVTGSGRIENTLFRKFTSTDYGCILWVESTYASAVNCTVVDSELSNYANSGMSTYYPAVGIRCPSGTIKNCAVFGISRIAFGSYPATDQAAWDGTASCFDHCATDDDDPINDSCFVDKKETAFRNYAAGNLNPKLYGCLINAGAEVSAPALDLQGRKRILGKTIDIGCYEGIPFGTTVIFR